MSELKNKVFEYEQNSYKGESKLMGNYGWVQNTSNLSTVRDTVELIPEHGCTHNELMKNIFKFRKDEGSIRKKWTWDARCRIKAVCATGMAEIDRENNGYILTELGKELKQAKKSEQLYKGKRILTENEINIFRKGILTNPPVIRVLTLLNEHKKKKQLPLSKYDVGSMLGFAGDIGFTHYEAEYVVKLGKKFNNLEGDSDKWARTIISWLIQVQWVVKSDNIEIFKQKLIRYTTTYEVDRVLHYSAKSAIKYVPEEMLCSDHHPFASIIQHRRMAILKKLEKAKIINISELVDFLKSQDIDTDEETLAFDILNLKQAGFSISQERSSYILLDKLKLSEYKAIPQGSSGSVEGIEKEIERMVTKYADSLPSKLVDNLIRYANDGKTTSAALFEMSIDKFFTIMGYETTCFGQGHGRVADVIAKYKAVSYPKSYAIIIDAKAYKKYNFPAGDLRKMKEYIKFHGPELLTQDRIPNHSFAFVSMDFTNPEEKLKEIEQETVVSGTAIKVNSLLELGSRVVKNQCKIEDLYSMFTNNQLFEIA